MDSSIVDLIGNIGFPILVTLYLLTRFEKKIDILSSAINNLTNLISSMVNKTSNTKTNINTN